MIPAALAPLAVLAGLVSAHCDLNPVQRHWDKPTLAQRRKTWATFVVGALCVLGVMAEAYLPGLVHVALAFLWLGDVAVTYVLFWRLRQDLQADSDCSQAAPASIPTPAGWVSPAGRPGDDTRIGRAHPAARSANPTP